MVMEMTEEIYGFLLRWLPGFDSEKPELYHRGGGLHRRTASLGVYLRTAGTEVS